jgi:two-component sensor histidine kinase
VAGNPIRVKDGQEVSLLHTENDVSITFTGLSYNNGDDIIYRYKLHPDDPWRFTRSNSVHLPELPSEHYQFTVSAKGRSGTWSDDAVISFTIAQSFWQTLWFKIVCAFALAGVLWLGMGAYVEQQKKEMRRQHRVTLSELRSLRAQMNPHFVFNALNSIQGVLLKNNLTTTQDYLSRFGKLMRTILDHSDKSSITISEELESIINYLEIEILRTNEQFQYKIEVDPALDTHNTEIPAMILQPFIENSIWHGFGQKTGDNLLIIRFDLQGEDQVVITIEDNGIGRKKARELRTSTHRSKGVGLVQERIDILNLGSERKITLNVKDLEDEQGNSQGTRVSLTIPTL